MKFPEQFRAHFQQPPASLYNSRRGDRFGAFLIPAKCDQLFCIVSSGDTEDAPHGMPRWEHVSVTVRNKRSLPLQRCATWEQMCLVKDSFWDETDAVVQYHPAKSEYVNNHRFCLHLWRPVELVLPTPPSIFVGFKS